MKSKDEMKFSNTIGGAAMMPAQQTTPATLSPADLEAENPWNGEQLSPEAREQYFGKPKPQPAEEYEDEEYDDEDERR